jgi:hypothetical protein
MASVDDIVTEVSDLLSDNEEGCANVRWSRSSIKHWLLEGYLLASTVARHKNSEIVEIPLVEGAVQSLPEGYEEFIRVVSNPGTFEKLADSAEKIAVDRYKGLYDAIAETGECVTATTNSGKTVGIQKLADGDYEVTGWEAEPMSATTFYVEPPVPKGYTGKLKVLAIKTIDLSDDDAEIPMWAHSLSIDWALHRAWSRDIESQYAFQRAQESRANFYGLLALFKPVPRGSAGPAMAARGASQQ